MESPRSILIIQTAFIGDVILATALVESLHRKFPDVALDFLVRKGNEGLLKGNPQLRTVFVFDKSQKYKNLIALIKEIRANRYDITINVQRFATTGLLTIFSGAKRTVGFTKNPFSFLFSKRIKHEINGTHEVQRNHSLVEWMVGPEVAKPKLYPSSQEIEKVKVYKVGSYITVSPASVWYTKQLKKERWIEFLAGLPHDLNVFLLGAASDFELCEVIKVEAPSARIVNLAGKLSMLESAALMCEAKMNYVNDSAPMHLASAMNAPVTAVFCSTVPKFGFGPLSDKSFVVETTEQLGCRPCGLHGYRACPKSHFKCALTIGKEQLMATLN